MSTPEKDRVEIFAFEMEGLKDHLDDALEQTEAVREIVGEANEASARLYELRARLKDAQSIVRVALEYHEDRATSQ